jgi:hypothetical protein
MNRVFFKDHFLNNAVRNLTIEIPQLHQDFSEYLRVIRRGADGY